MKFGGHVMFMAHTKYNLDKSMISEAKVIDRQIWPLPYAFIL
jgi:hypothetical protein